MSMSLVLVKLTPQLHAKVVDARGDLLTGLLRGNATESGFDRGVDVFEGLDYRDLSLQAEDEEDPFYQLFQGAALVEGYEWAYGPPTYFDPSEARGLHELLVEVSDFWPFSDVAAFLGQAVTEGKGVVVGVA